MTIEQYPIAKQIPIPPATRGRGAAGVIQYPLHEMEVGDSFFVGGKKSRHINCYFKKLLPKRFTTRACIESEVKGLRVWRFE